MPTFSFTSPEGKTYDIDGPEGSTQEQAFQMLQQHLGGAGSSNPKSIPDVPPQPVPAKAPTTWERLKGAGEAGLSVLSGATGGLVGMVGGTLGGLAGAIASGKIGTPEGAQMLEDVATQQAQRFTYQPRTQTGQEALQFITPALQTAGAIPPAQGIAAGSMIGPAVSQVRNAGVRGAFPGVGAVMDEVANARTAEIPGYGAAMTPQAVIRNERAQSLPVPIQLTRGQAERTFEQQRFERETAKQGSVGEPLRQRFANQNEQILQNFDAWVDDTGAQAPSLRATGQIVSQAIADKAAKAKAAIKAAYDEAEKAGETSQPVSVAPLVQYVEQKRPEAINAPVITSLEAKLKAVSKDGMASINDLEEVRKMVGTLGGKDATNSYFAREIKSVIDNMTEGAGGEAYKRARALRARYGREFENVGVVDKLLSTKPGTTDRAVAFENVFDHSILNGSLDDVRMIRKTLQTGGEGGQQAWKELQGQTLGYIRDAATSNASRDIRGNPIVSFAKLDKAINELDRSGKLDFIFGKEGAQHLRDIRDIAGDVHTSPPGAVNTSNTGSVVLQALGNMAGSFVTGKLPAAAAAAAKIGGVAKDYMAQRKVRAQVQDALNPFPQSGLQQLLP